jgi:hypothetical protein
LRKIGLLLSILLLLLMFVMPAASAQSTAATAAPPEANAPIQLQSIFGSGYDYLFTGSVPITDVGNKKVSISGSSSAILRVDAIGVQLTLQQWTGSKWIDVYKSPSSASSASSNTYRNHEVSVTVGYYYRVKSDHWVQHGKIREAGTLYSASLLIPQ